MPAPEKHVLFGSDWKEAMFNLEKTQVTDSEVTFS